MDIYETELFDSIEQLPGDWEPLVTGPEAWLLAEEAMEDEDSWEAMAIAYEYLQQEAALSAVDNEQAETSDLLSLFA